MSWRAHAACLGTPPELFFPIDSRPSLVAEAQRFCASCPVRKQCLKAAIKEEAMYEEDRLIFGVRGGLSAAERKANRRVTRVTKSTLDTTELERVG